jgi:cell division initiation protein
MKLTPLDIHHKEFRNSLRGYNPEEVDDFLDEVADEFERLFKENIDLSEKYDAAQERLRGYAEMEQALQKAFVSSQAAADDTVARARADADRLVKDAEAKAQEIVTGALEEKQHTQAETARLQAAEDDFRARFRSMLEQYLSVLAPVSAAEAMMAASEPVAEVNGEDTAQLIMDAGLVEEPEAAPAVIEEPESKPTQVVSIQLGEVGEEPDLEEEFPTLEVPAEFGVRKPVPVGELDDDIEEID